MERTTNSLQIQSHKHTHTRARTHDSIQFFDSRARRHRRRQRRGWETKRRAKKLRRTNEGERECVGKRKMNRPEIINIIIIKKPSWACERDRFRLPSRTAADTNEHRRTQIAMVKHRYRHVGFATTLTSRLRRIHPLRRSSYFSTFLAFFHSFIYFGRTQRDAKAMAGDNRHPNTNTSVEHEKEMKICRETVRGNDIIGAKVLPRRVFWGFSPSAISFFLFFGSGDAMKPTLFEVINAPRIQRPQAARFLFRFFAE